MSPAKQFALQFERELADAGFSTRAGEAVLESVSVAKPFPAEADDEALATFTRSSRRSGGDVRPHGASRPLLFEPPTHLLVPPEMPLR